MELFFVFLIFWMNHFAPEKLSEPFHQTGHSTNRFRFCAEDFFQTGEATSSTTTKALVLEFLRVFLSAQLGSPRMTSEPWTFPGRKAAPFTAERLMELVRDEPEERSPVLKEHCLISS